MRKRLAISPKLPMNEDQWVRVVTTWLTHGRGQIFDLKRFLATRRIGTIRTTSDTIQATYMHDCAQKSKSFAPGVVGSVHLSKINAWAWLEDEADRIKAAPPRARSAKPTARASNPDLPRGVCRREAKDRRGATVVQFEASVTNAAGQPRQKRLVAGRIGVATEDQIEAARAAAIAYRAAWVRATDLGDRSALDMDWSNWRAHFGPKRASMDEPGGPPITGGPGAPCP